MSSILAIDPGCTQSGFVRMADTRIVENGIASNDEILSMLRFYCRSFDVLEPRIAIEQIRNMGMIVGQEVFDTVFWTGRFYEAVMMFHVPRPQLIPRNAIKLHLCGSPRAKDANIRAALIDRFGAPGTKKAPGGTYGVKSHAWSALAVAAYAIDHPQESQESRHG